jgi:two-component system, OmpR family, sensor histidine kinase BaeS
MRRSLLVRFVAVAVTVALGTAAATAWLTTRGASERFRGEFQQTLEADQFIYESLRQYAIEHTNWEGATLAVRRLVERTGRRIALTTLQGDVLLDSADLFDEDRDALPRQPAAVIDVLSRSSQPSGDQSAPIEVLDNPPAALALTPQEAAARRVLAERAAQCVSQRGQAAQVETDLRGAPTVRVGERRDPVNASDPCVPDGLFAPSSAQLAAEQQRRDLTAACLSGAGLTGPGPVPAPAGDTGIGRVQPTAPEPPLRVPEPASGEYQACLDTARQQALTPFVAEPVRLYLGSPSGRFDIFSSDDARRAFTTVAVVLLVATAISVLAGRRLVRPIRGLTAAAQRMEGGDRQARVPVSGRDEVAQLGHAFNAMADAVERNEAQRRGLISDLAHELRNPLVNIRGDLEAAEDGVVALDGALVTSLLEETTLLERLIADLNDLALADAGMLGLHPVDCDLGELVRQVVTASRSLAESATVRLTIEAPEPASVRADPARIRQAVGNLVVNAVRYTPAGGTVTVAVLVVAQEAHVRITDTGSGIDAEHLPHIFDRFYRADPSRSRETGGTGLGLAITRHLIEGHGGTIDVTSTPGQGSTFTIRLPLGPAAPSLHSEPW